ncbi:MAG: hypothetical protein IKP78_09725 [Ruminococcus sp.]|nr:hypothetical protein [Ruminococcus sp.]
MFDYLDVLLAFALIALVLFLTYRMYRSDRQFEDSRENGQFAPLVYSRENSWNRRERDLRNRRKYGLVGCILLVLIIYSVLRMNGTIGSIL